MRLQAIKNGLKQRIARKNSEKSVKTQGILSQEFVWDGTLEKRQ